MIKKIIEGSCKAVKEDTYSVMVDSVDNMCILLKDNYKGTSLNVVLDKEDALKLANNILDCYNGKGEYENV